MDRFSSPSEIRMCSDRSWCTRISTRLSGPTGPISLPSFCTIGYECLHELGLVSGQPGHVSDILASRRSGWETGILNPEEPTSREA